MIEKQNIFNSYQLIDIDDNGTYPNYYSFMDADGNWYIIRESSNLSLRYYRGSFRIQGLYSNAWDNRAVLTYMLWETSF